MLAFSLPTPPPGPSPFSWSAVQNPTVEVAGQGNALTHSHPERLDGPVRVLQVDRALYDTYERNAVPRPGQNPLSVPASPYPFAQQAQAESEQVRVLDAQAREPLVRSQGGRLEGDPHVLESLHSAEGALRQHAEGLGRPLPLRNGKLSIRLNTSNPSDVSHNRGATGPNIDVDPRRMHAALDPDAIAHETGHAILDSQRLAYNDRSTPQTMALHESFADATALVRALHDPEVVADQVQARREGRTSTLASSIGEGAVHDTLHPRQGVRDLAGAAPAVASSDETFHADSLKFSTGFYQSLVRMDEKNRQDHPDLSPEASLGQARDRLGSDLSRTLDFLPVGNRATQADLARALLKADQVDHGGENAALYRKAFQEAGLDLGAGQPEAALPELKLPASLAYGTPFQARGADNNPTRQAADGFLEAHREQLGLPAGLKAQELYQNDRGETFLVLNDGSGRYDESARAQGLLGFDRDGRLFHRDFQAD